jgi:hypothetical protein
MGGGKGKLVCPCLVFSSQGQAELALATRLPEANIRLCNNFLATGTLNR